MNNITQTYHSNKVSVVGVEEDDAQREVNERGDNGADGTPKEGQGHHGVDDEHLKERKFKKNQIIFTTKNSPRGACARRHRRSDSAGAHLLGPAAGQSLFDLNKNIEKLVEIF